MVRGTVRSLNAQKNEHIYSINPSKKDNIELVAADLLDDSVWDKVIQGCDYVCHVASPLLLKPPKDENEFINPAVNGTTCIMNACIKHKVKKLVMTSSVAAVYPGRDYKDVHNEDHWSIIQK